MASALRKFTKFCNENIVFIAGGSIIVGVHWGWSRLQDIPTLVDPAEKKEMPIWIFAKYVGRVTTDRFNQLTNNTGTGGDPEVPANK